MIPSWSHRFTLLVPIPWWAPSKPWKTHIPIRLREKQRWTKWIHTLPTFKNTNGDTRRANMKKPQMDTENGIWNKYGGWNWRCRSLIISVWLARAPLNGAAVFFLVFQMVRLLRKSSQWCNCTFSYSKNSFCSFHPILLGPSPPFFPFPFSSTAFHFE